MSTPQLIAHVRSKADVDAAVKAGFKAVDYNVDAVSFDAELRLRLPSALSSADLSLSLLTLSRASRPT